MYEKNLNTLLDALTDTSVYVIEEETHKLLYFNQRCEDTGHGCARLGRKCSEVWPRTVSYTHLPHAGMYGCGMYSEYYGKPKGIQSIQGCDRTDPQRPVSQDVLSFKFAGG